MANDNSNEVFDFSNIEFTREDLVSVLNDMVDEYQNLSQTFENAKAENKCLKDNSDDPSYSQLDDSDNLKTELMEHCDVLSMQMDIDLVIYRTILVRTFQVVTICRVDKSEILVVLISPHYSKHSIGYPRMSASGESSTTMHRLLHASGPHPIPPPNDPKTNQYNQDLGLIHSTNGNHLESPNEGSSIDHQALSVILRGSGGDVSRSFTMIRWQEPPPLLTPSPTAADHHAPPTVRRAAARRRCSRDCTCSDHIDKEIPFVSNSSALLVQTDEGVMFPVVDRIRRSTVAYLEVPVSL
ncbi:hypothetical protein F511_31487 [Dorcoceras hygrometricum]|uniref:Uncharacterized protein n=1 Tax=Dorcoceras hygrometricum TaxID=472368 RepID=A0A2Z7D401_9LAMI|nr:hypothetical protein F511_31487 [Dorcoceras hygrometricum]